MKSVKVVYPEWDNDVVFHDIPTDIKCRDMKNKIASLLGHAEFKLAAGGRILLDSDQINQEVVMVVPIKHRLSLFLTSLLFLTQMLPLYALMSGANLAVAFLWELVATSIFWLAKMIMTGKIEELARSGSLGSEILLLFWKSLMPEFRLEQIVRE